MNIKKRSWKLKTNTNAIEEGAMQDIAPFVMLMRL